MATIPEIGKPIQPTTTAGISFEEAQRDFLWQRLMMTTILGLAISVIMVLFHRVIVNSDELIEASLSGWILDLHYGHVGTFGLALVVFYLGRRRWPVRRLRCGGAVLVGLNLVIGIVADVLLAPTTIDFFTISLLLFLPAAFIPWPGRFQCTLGVIALVTFAAMQVIAFHHVPATRAIWMQAGGIHPFRQFLLTGMVAITILAGASDLTSRTLYTLRRTAHHAKRLGNYDILRKLGKGGMGTVYLARHAIICRPTAIKVLSEEAGPSPQALARFEREVHLSASLTHPNTINIYDFGRTEDNVFYYAMEYLTGMDLRTIVQRFGPLCPERAAFIAAHVCGSLGEAHARGIIHRDIKPSNVFLTQRGGLYDFVKVLDFGLAKQTNADLDSHLTQTGVIFGTADFIAPEAAYGSDTIDTRSDIYNLGGVIYWMLTGQPPFVSESSLRVIVDHVKTDPVPPSKMSELPIPPELDALVMKCLAKDPGDRYQRTAEIMTELEAISWPRPWSHARAAEWWELHGLTCEIPDDFNCAAEGRAFARTVPAAGIIPSRGTGDTAPGRTASS